MFHVAAGITALFNHVHTFRVYFKHICGILFTKRILEIHHTAQIPLCPRAAVLFA